MVYEGQFAGPFLFYAFQTREKMLEPIYIGIDIGGTNTVFALIQRDGSLLAFDSIPTQADLPLSHLLDRLQRRLDPLIAKHTMQKRLMAIGVGAPNTNALTGWLKAPPNLSWESCDLVDAFQSRFHVPIALTNDANAAALGEFAFGAGRGVQHLLAITLGTGLGAGFIVEGKLLHGSTGMAGELGHIPMDFTGRPCSCGLNACLETWVSAKGMGVTLQEILDSNNLPSPLRVIDAQPRDIFLAAQIGDPFAKTCFDLTGEYLGRALALTVAITSPEMILLCGGIAQAGDFLLEPTRRAFRKYCLPTLRDSVHIGLGGLPADHAGVLGAAQWARIQSS
jgi:glucokinase